MYHPEAALKKLGAAFVLYGSPEPDLKVCATRRNCGKISREDGGKVMEKAQESKARAMCASDWIRVPVAPGRYFVYLVIVGVV